MEVSTYISSDGMITSIIIAKKLFYYVHSTAEYINSLLSQTPQLMHSTAICIALSTRVVKSSNTHALAYAQVTTDLILKVLYDHNNTVHVLYALQGCIFYY